MLFPKSVIDSRLLLPLFSDQDASRFSIASFALQLLTLVKTPRRITFCADFAYESFSGRLIGADRSRIQTCLASSFAATYASRGESKTIISQSGAATSRLI